MPRLRISMPEELAAPAEKPGTDTNELSSGEASQTGSESDEQLHLEAMMTALSNSGDQSTGESGVMTTQVLEWFGCWAQSDRRREK